ncbi:MAG: metallophosphoesterase family protein [Coriobacteriia bacterium]|nr:metallophosphoesterase family protein [Coriobacteriia bacterium]
MDIEQPGHEDTPPTVKVDRTEDAAATRSRRASAAWYLTVSGVLIIAAAVGLAAFGGFARYSFEVGPARISASAVPALRPATTVVVPPFGSIRAVTHRTPLSVRVSLDEVDVPQLEAFATAGIPGKETVDGLIADVRAGFRTAAYRGLFAAALAGAFVGWSLRRSLRSVLASAVIAALVPALLVGVTISRFDTEAFRTPTFRGAVSYAPSLIELVQLRAEKVESLRDQVGKLVRDLSRYYASPQSFAPAGALEGTYRVLHVTDLHLDPVGLELAEELATEFGASLVIDTGDINHYGSPAEATVVASAIPTSVPQVFVPGNHDSPAVVAALDALGHVTVVRDEMFVVDGLRIFGVADPASEGTGVEPDGGAMRERADALAVELREALASGEPTPTIVAAHNTAMVDAFIGIAPLVIAGHSHTPLLERRDDTWYLNSGTTGGIHFSKMRPEPHIPHSASILYYTGDLPRRLIAIDQIEVFGLAGQSSLRRTVIDESLLP